MARSKFQSWLLRTQIKCEILFDPDKLEPDTGNFETKRDLSARFAQLPDSQIDAYRIQFKTHQPLAFFPLHVYRLSHPNREEGRGYGIHWEYDRPERKQEMMRLALAGFDLNRLGRTYYTYTQLREMRKAQEAGLDVSCLLDNRFSRFQMMVLTKIMRDGADPTDYADPHMPANEMANAYAEQVEDRMVSEAIDNEFDRVWDAAAELDDRFAYKEYSGASLEALIANAKERAEEEAVHSEGKIINFPTPKHCEPEI